MKIKPSEKIVNGVQCWDILKGKNILKTYITKAYAEAYIAEMGIQKYVNSKSYKKEIQSLTIS